MDYLKPELLVPGDEVAIVAVSKKIDFNDIRPSIDILENWGLKVHLAKNLHADPVNIFAGSDKERLEGFQGMIDNKKIKAIFCSRGGYGLSRIIDQIDFGPLLDSLKWIIGFSDISLLLNHMANLGMPSIHGPMAFQFHDKSYATSLQSLRRALFDEEYVLTSNSHPLNIHGSSVGMVVGGNLTMIINALGTASDFDTSGKILLLEEIEEYIYKMDRMMVHLKRAGKLNNLAGIIVGHMTNMLDNSVPYGKTVHEVIHDHVSALGIPVCFGFPAGHEPDNLAVPFGRQARFEVTEKEASIRFI